MSSATCCAACVRLEAALDVRCPQRDDVVEWSGCRSDSAVLTGVATSCRGCLADASGPFGWPSKMIMASAVHCCRAHGASASGCVAPVPPRNNRLRRASSPHLPPTSRRMLCSMAGVYKFIMPSSGIRKQVRVRRFFHKSVRNGPLTRFWEP